MHLADGNISVVRSRLSEGVKGVDETVSSMQEMALGQYGARSAKIRALAINVLNDAKVENKDYYGMIVALGEWVRDNIRYVKDPVGQETLSYPEETAFNSLAGDCDDMTILVIALLGSLGIRGYPVVVGMTPGAYSHVYAYAVVPAGRHRMAGKTVAVDAIMREWPIGKEAPSDKVRAKKTYPHLAGLDAMNIGAYADAPSYLNERNVDEVETALNRRSVDAGSYGEMFNTAKVQQGAEGADSMFAMELAPEAELYSRGPVQAADAAGSVDFLGQQRVYECHVGSKPLKLGRMGGHGKQTTVVIDAGSTFDAPFMRGPNAGPKSTVKPMVSAREIEGLAAYICGLEGEIDRTGCGHFAGIGSGDPLRLAGAAAHYAQRRAARARWAAQRIAADAQSLLSGGLAGPEESSAAVEVAHAARKVSQAADMAAVRAEQVADKAARTPGRRAAMDAVRRNLRTIDDVYNVTDIIVMTPDGEEEPFVAVGANVMTLSAMGRSLPIPTVTNAVKSGLVTPLVPGSKVFDARGERIDEMVENVDMAGLGFGISSFKKAVKKAKSKVAKVVKTVKATAVGAVKAVAGKKKGSSAAPVYTDANGKKISKKEYDKQMKAMAAEQTYADASGNPITKAEYDKQMAAMGYIGAVTLSVPATSTVAPLVVPGGTTSTSALVNPIPAGSVLPAPSGGYYTGWSATPAGLSIPAPGGGYYTGWSATPTLSQTAAAPTSSGYDINAGSPAYQQPYQQQYQQPSGYDLNAPTGSPYGSSMMPVPGVQSGSYNANASVPGGAPVDDFGPEDMSAAQTASSATADESESDYNDEGASNAAVLSQGPSNDSAYANESEDDLSPPSDASNGDASYGGGGDGGGADDEAAEDPSVEGLGWGGSIGRRVRHAARRAGHAYIRPASLAALKARQKLYPSKGINGLGDVSPAAPAVPPEHALNVLPEDVKAAMLKRPTPSSKAPFIIGSLAAVGIGLYLLTRKNQ